MCALHFMFILEISLLKTCCTFLWFVCITIQYSCRRRAKKWRILYFIKINSVLSRPGTWVANFENELSPVLSVTFAYFTEITFMSIYVLNPSRISTETECLNLLLPFYNFLQFGVKHYVLDLYFFLLHI